MEYVSFLKGEQWSDNPECVDPLIGNMMRFLNDTIHDNGVRSKLLVPLIGKVMACTPTAHRDRTMGVFSWVVNKHRLPPRCTCGHPSCLMNNPLQVIENHMARSTPEEAARLAEEVLDAFIRCYGLADDPVEVTVVAEAEAKILAGAK
jgi:phenylpyruvate tautomerase PptA (4-oxalocrotonate tautomerase family)